MAEANQAASGSVAAVPGRVIEAPIKVMKLDDVLRRVRDRGGMLLVGEYRGTKREQMTFRDEKSGKSETSKWLEHLVEFEGDTGPDAIFVQERYFDEGWDPETWKAPPELKRGVRVVGQIEVIRITKRGKQARLKGNALGILG